LPGTFKAAPFEELGRAFHRGRLHVVHHYVDRAEKHVSGRDGDASQPKDKMTGRYLDAKGELLLAAHERGGAP
jgi:hypothetical protein